jgi:hypothetical protein
MATNSIDLVTVKNAFKARLIKTAPFVWQGQGNSANTGFADVYTALLLDKEKQASPWLCIVDAPPAVTNKGMKASFYGKQTPLQFYVCADYVALGVEDAEKRVIEAYQALESFLCNATEMDALGLPSYEYDGWQPFKTEDLQVRGRILTLKVVSKVDIN